jgi:hypothetical protein
MSMSACINCGKLPEVVDSDDTDYKYMLKHKDSNPCYPTYMLITYQNTKEECAYAWNKLNQNNRTGLHK